MSDLGTSTFGLDDGDEEEPKIYGSFWGFVSSNSDPTGRGRVRAQIPGLNITESTWAEAIGMPGGGGGNHGIWAVPEVGATILVTFIQGDPDHPIYFCATAPVAELPDGAKVNNIICQTKDFRISLAQDDNHKKLRLETLLPDVPESSRDLVRSVIEIDINAGTAGKSHVINITAPTAIVLKSKGTISIDAPTVTIKGRPIMPSDRGI